MSEDYTVENLNPRSQAVKSLEMVVRRAIALDKLAQRHTDICNSFEIDPYVSPRIWGSIDKRAGGPDNPRTLIGELGLDDLELDRQWPVLYRAWVTGSLDRQIREMLDSLPAEIRQAKRYKDWS
jgi:hypothetical protein